MPKKKSTKKKPVPKKVFFPCQYCGKGLKSIQGKTIHEKSCPLNPINQQQPQQVATDIEAVQQAEKITPQMQEKIENILDTDKKQEATFLLKGLNDQQQQILKENRPLTDLEKNQFKEVLEYLQHQKEISSYDKAEKTIKGQTKVYQASEILDSIKPAQNLTVQQAVALDIIQDTRERKQLHQLYMQQKIENLNNPKKSSDSVDFQKQVFDLQNDRIKSLEKNRSEGNIKGMVEDYEAIKKLGETFSDKEKSSPGNELVNEIAKSVIPGIVDMGKEALKKKQQQQQNFPTPQTPNISPEQNPEIASGENNQSENVSQSESLIEKGPGQQPSPAQASPEPTDAQLLADNSLRDPNRPAQDYSDLDFAQNLYMSAESPALPTSTAPQS